MGVKYTGIFHVTFLIGPDGKIKKWAQNETGGSCRRSIDVSLV